VGAVKSFRITRAATAATILACACLVGSVSAAPPTAPAKSATPAPAVPRLADGHPDLNGTWDNGSGIDFIQPQKFADGSTCVSGCPPAQAARPPGGGAPRQAPVLPQYRPELLAKVADLDKRQVDVDPVLRCQNPGLPRIGPPDKIVQQKDQIVFLYDDVSGAFWRIIPMDGRRHRTDVDPSFLGDSIGHWEGDTLVIEADQFNDSSWLTDNGAFHSTALKVTERLHRVGDVIEYQAIVEDPKVLAEPWKPRPRMLKLTHDELAEPAPCADQDMKHLVDDSHHANPR
jgi:hypothetical protein